MQREHEIKTRLQNVGPILTDGALARCFGTAASNCRLRGAVEVLKDLKCSACSLEQQLARAFFLSHNEDMKNTAQSLCHNACDQVCLVLSPSRSLNFPARLRPDSGVSAEAGALPTARLLPGSNRQGTLS